jgi:glyoxylase-like metal-dependent hydrolase (beta-lactamase superfamily II)
MNFDRRLLLAGTAAAAAATSLPLARTVAQAQQAAPTIGQAPGFYRYKIGDVQVTAINDGQFARPLEGFIRNAPLPDVQKALQDQFLPVDRLPIPFTTIVVGSGDRLTLIDTGNGNSGAPTSGTWMTNFRAAGFDPANVRTVVISHFHGDHINGLRLKEGTAMFPNAEIMVPAAEWDFWMDDGRMAAAPDAMKPAFNNVRRVFGPVQGAVKRYDWGKEVMPGITAVDASGHTPGHTAFVIAAGNERLLVLSDTTNHPALFVRNPDWQAIFDMDANKATATRRKLLDMAVTDRMQVCFYHAPFPATGNIVKDGNGFRLIPVQWSSQV